MTAPCPTCRDRRVEVNVRGECDRCLRHRQYGAIVLAMGPFHRGPWNDPANPDADPASCEFFDYMHGVALNGLDALAALMIERSGAVTIRLVHPRPLSEITSI
jgi:hypothetical protein